MNVQQRAEKVANSQGKSLLWARSLSDQEQEELADLTLPDGSLVSDIRARFASWVGEWCDKKKVRGT